MSNFWTEITKMKIQKFRIGTSMICATNKGILTMYNGIVKDKVADFEKGSNDLEIMSGSEPYGRDFRLHLFVFFCI